MAHVHSIRWLLFVTFGLATSVLLIGATLEALATQRLSAQIDDMANEKLPSVQAVGALHDPMTAIARGVDEMMLRRASPALWKEAHRETLAAWGRLDRAAEDYERIPDDLKGGEQWTQVKKTLAAWRSAIGPLTNTLEEREDLVLAGRDPQGVEIQALDERAWRRFLAGRAAFALADEAMTRLVANTMESAAQSRDESSITAGRVDILIRIAIVLGAGFLFILGYFLIRGTERTVAVLKQETDRLSDAVCHGRLNIRGDPNAVSSEFRPLIDSANRIMDALERPVRLTAEYVGRIARGDLPTITEHFAGDLAVIKDALNTCVGTLKATGAEFVGLDLTTGRMSAGPRLTAWMGRAENGLGDARLEDVVRLIADEDRECVFETARAHLAGHLPALEAEFRIRLPSGDVRWIHVRGRVVDIDADGRPTRCAGIVLDITEMRAIRQQLVFADRLASLGTLAASVGHELNNPLSFLTANVGFVRTALRDQGPDHSIRPELLEALDDGLTGAQRMRDIIDTLRRLGHPGSDPLIPVDLKPEIEAAVKLARSELRNHARMAVEVDAVATPVMARGNELCQVFLNLLVNAAQSIPEGRPNDHEVSIRASMQGDDVAVAVRDDGAGIAPEALQRIFEPFYTTKPAGKGTGLGLSVTHRIVEGLGGRIEVESTLGQGSLFRVFLPTARSNSIKRRGQVLMSDKHRVVPMPGGNLLHEF